MYDEIENENLLTSSDDWKQKARAQFETWLEQIGDTAVPDKNDQQTIPDINSFYRELCALRSEVRTMGRRTQETLGRFGETLDVMKDTSEKSVPDKNSGAMSSLYTPLTDLHMRFSRINSRFKSQPLTKWLWGSAKRLSADWNSQADAFRLVSIHLDNILREMGLRKIDTIGKQFDPSRMSAVEITENADLPDGTVTEEIASGFEIENRIIRYAEVKVNQNKGV
jgi:molecular chaperone GrpE